MTVNAAKAVGRADLIRLLALDADEAQRRTYVRMCGYEPREVKREEPAEVGAGPSTGYEYLGEVARAEVEKTAKLGFWRVCRAEHRDEEEQSGVPDWFLKARPITRKDLQKERPPEDRPYPYLTPWSRLWPFLRQALTRTASGRALDAPHLVRQMAGLKPIRRLPHRQVRRWAGSIHVLCDRSEALRTCYADMDELVKRLRTICGRHRLKLFIFPTGLTSSCYHSGKVEMLDFRTHDLPDIVLALSDLGALTGNRAVRDRAREIGRKVRLAGGRAMALSPCPTDRWFPGLAREWRTVWWDLGRRLRTRGYRPSIDNASEDRGARRDEVSTPPGQETLLRLMGPVVKPDPELVRRIRALLPPDQTNVGLEAGICLNRFDYHSRINEFPSIKPPVLKKRLVDLLIWFHADFPEILNEELTIIQSVDPELAAELEPITDEMNADLAASLKDGRWRAGGFSKGEFVGYMNRRERRLPDKAYEDERVAAAWIFNHLNEDGELDVTDIPPDLPVKDLAWAFKRGQRQVYYLSQVRQSLAAAQEYEGGAGLHSSLGLFYSSLDLAFVKALNGVTKTRTTWRLSEPGPDILNSHHTGRRYRVETIDSMLELEQIGKPSWAGGMGRDQYGLFVSLDGTELYYWLNPGKYSVVIEGIGNDLAEISEGCWLGAEIFFAFINDGFLTPAWEDHLVEDQFGLYEQLHINGIRQVFRWISPGRFMMGSPENEPERSENELLHEVELTRGFWLADTACTQALWEAVMGNNPSHFKGPERPVESVSWEDCQEFIARINKLFPESEFRLPIEAEWEYACRAGTAKPFWFGKQITPEQVNYDGNNPYAGGEKGLNRGETVEVRSLPPNGWGLYEMHGNILEWCADWYGAYEEGQAVDPRGPLEGVGRVLRGGSWINFAGDCRSADRGWDHPGIRYDGGFGFRLARGQKD